ncbi:hypothetical protein BY458DRAFT_545426 [Sporodiniella umbellata]|nr:hypothetical protein BY458DRAFT_545426 [Sporodiniella umbellata]
MYNKIKELNSKRVHVLSSLQGVFHNKKSASCKKRGKKSPSDLKETESHMLDLRNGFLFYFFGQAVFFVLVVLADVKMIAAIEGLKRGSIVSDRVRPQDSFGCNKNFQGHF